MAEIIFPDWVTNPTPPPVGTWVRCKKLLYIFTSCEFARLLHNAVWKWYRGKPLTGQDEEMLQAEFPDEWPVPPDEEQVKGYIKNRWKPRQSAVSEARTHSRKQAKVDELDFVDWNGLID